MQGDSHRIATQFAFEFLRGKDPTLPLLDHADSVALRAVDIDADRDLEFVDVEGGVGSGGRDDPHRDDAWAIDDEPHTTEEGRPLTTYSHFIDVKKGSGAFDDYDGYSYANGSASKDQFELARDAVGSTWEALLASIVFGDRKVDEGLAWWFGDEYIHAPGQSWYRPGQCSPALERYVRGIPTMNDECKARFPLADSVAKPGLGFQHSVFPPVDNLARWWLGRFEATHEAAALGPVLHAIHDVSIPHHAAGCCGNWHGRYEQEVNSHLDDWIADPAFRAEVAARFDAWWRDDATPPAALAPGDWQREPARNWRVEMLVTWMALCAYRAYDQVYGHFRSGYRFDVASARDLTSRSIALTLLVLGRASGYVAPVVRAGPRIAATPFAHNFGWVPPGVTRSFTFEARSDGTAPLDVASVDLFGLRPPGAPGPFRLATVQPAAPSTLAVGEVLRITVSYAAPRMLRGTIESTRSEAPGVAAAKPRAGVFGIPPSYTASLNPAFKPYAGVLVIRSNATNAPVVALHVRAGGLPLPWILERELAEVRRRTPGARDARARTRAMDAEKELEELGKLWR